MNNSPLLLEKIFFRKIRFEVNLSETKELIKPPFEYNLDCKVDCDRSVAHERKFLVFLTVTITPGPENKPTPYAAEIDLEGRFAIDESLAKERWVEVAVANGAAVLFGMVREFVTSVTARSQYPVLTLPSVNFIDDAIRINELAVAEGFLGTPREEQGGEGEKTL